MIRVPFEDLIGKTCTSAKLVHSPTGRPIALCIETDDGCQYSLEHEQDCCEAVWIEELEGDVESLVGSPILVAEEASNSYHSSEDHKILHTLHNRGPLPRSDESFTWTFYKLATVKGWVDIRFYGTSNGYYSESVSFLRIK